MDVVVEVMSQPWRWGERDCCASACAVFHRLHGIDPMADLRGLCGTRAEAEAFMAAHGGMAAMVAHRLAAAGLVKTDEPQPGDIGLSVERNAMCVRVEGGKWAAKSPRGFTLIDSPVMAWTLPG